MHQKLVVVTSYLRQTEQTGQLHSCSCQGQFKKLMEKHLLMDVERHFLRSVKCGPTVLLLLFHLIAEHCGLRVGMFCRSRLLYALRLSEETWKERLDREECLCPLRLHLRAHNTDQYNVTHVQTFHIKLKI